MLFMIVGKDKPDAAPVRQAEREAHLAYLRDAGDRLKFAGPFRDGETLDAPAGSLIIVEAASLSAAYLMAQNDPYTKAGVFASLEVKPLKPVLGTWV